MTPPRPRIAGVDYGTRRVGLAVSDPLAMFARPVGTFDPAGAIDQLARLAAETGGLATVVVGWPLAPDGTEGPAVDRVRPFIGRLRKALPDVEIVRWDERYSSQRASEILVAAGVRKGARREKGRLDQAAASVILQEYLDEHQPPPTGE